MIKKLLLLSLSFSCIQTMEFDSKISAKKYWILPYGKTNIHLTTKSLFNLYTRVDLTIVGKNAQSKLIKENNNKYQFPIFTIDNIAGAFEVGKTSTPRHITFPKGLTAVTSESKVSFLEIVEPCINQRYWSDGKNHISYKTQCRFWTDKKAIQQASQDLAKCYDIVLTKGSNELHAKTILIPTLSTKVGFSFAEAAPIAVETVMHFINNNDLSYNDIYLAVGDATEMNLYKLLLLKHSGLLYKICLFYWEHQNKNGVLAWLPRELRDYIVKFLL